MSQDPGPHQDPGHSRDPRQPSLQGYERRWLPVQPLGGRALPHRAGQTEAIPLLRFCTDFTICDRIK